MTSYKLVFTKNAVKDLSRLPKPIKTRIGKKLERFINQSNPFSGSKKLGDSVTADYRWRVGNYRILFDADGKNIVVLKNKKQKRSP